LSIPSEVNSAQSVGCFQDHARRTARGALIAYGTNILAAGSPYSHVVHEIHGYGESRVEHPEVFSLSPSFLRRARDSGRSEDGHFFSTFFIAEDWIGTERHLRNMMSN
jgi:hypothetical protein